MAYQTPAEFDRALKRAVRGAGGDPGAGYRQALRDRFLCRVFRGGRADLVLKGGSGMLARIPDARATRDVDFGLVVPGDADSVVADLVERASADLGDFCRFELTRREERMDDNGYSRLLKLRFSTYVGAEEKDPVLIDLSLDCAPTGTPVVADPVGRVALEGVESSPYVLYPVCDQLADKLCATMEVQPGGYPSSRMKDLVDIVLMARTQELAWRDLRVAVAAECARRGMAVPGRFEAPEFWRSGFARFARRQGVDVTFDGACEIAGALFDPVLGDVACGTWHPEGLRWGRR